MSNKSAENRSSNRAPLKAAVSLVSQDNFYTGLTRDISSGGVFVSSPKLFPIGTPVTLRLTLAPGKQEVIINGEVRWLRKANLGANMPRGMGVAFEGLDPRLGQKISRFVKTKRESLFYED